MVGGSKRAPVEEDELPQIIDGRPPLGADLRLESAEGGEGCGPSGVVRLVVAWHEEDGAEGLELRAQEGEVFCFVGEDVAYVA